MRLVCTRELLIEILDSGQAKLLEEPQRFNQRAHIRFQCKCGTEVLKTFEMLRNHKNPYCSACTKEAMKKKQIETCIRLYGVENAAKNIEKKKKQKETWQKNYGSHPKRTREVQEKWLMTCKIKYGGHPNQNAQVRLKTEKNGYKRKAYTLPSGKIIFLQGWEHIAMNELLEDYNEDEIQVGSENIPAIRYIDQDNKEHIYYPDIYIPSINTILEVKSEWTLNTSRAMIEERAVGVVSSGYRFIVWVYSKEEEGSKRIITFDSFEK